MIERHVKLKCFKFSTVHSSTLNSFNFLNTSYCLPQATNEIFHLSNMIHKKVNCRFRVRHSSKIFDPKKIAPD